MDNIFDDFCAAIGVVPLDEDALNNEDVTELVHSAAQFASWGQLHAESRNPAHLFEIGFIDAPEINAVAATYKGVDIIGINWGVIVQLRSLYRDLMATDVFSWIDQGSRPLVATWLFECAKHFIFLHEFGHVWNGHTSLISQRGLTLIDEINAFPNSQLGGIDRQTLEMDADGFASSNIFSLATKFHKFPVLNEQFEQEAGEGATHLAMASLSLFMVFRLFDAAVDFDYEHKSAHPSPPLRQRMIAGSMASAAAKYGSFEESLAHAIIYHGMVSGEDAYAKYASRDRDSTALDLAFTAEGLSYARRLLRHWRVLHPQLDILKRGGNLPPIQDVEDEP